MLALLPTTGLLARHAPVPAAHPVGDKATVFLRYLFPGEASGVERMDLAVGNEVVEVLVVRPRHEVIVAVQTRPWLTACKESGGWLITEVIGRGVAKSSAGRCEVVAGERGRHRRRGARPGRH